MMLNIHKINESLEKKYYLMEKYSDSMPDWLGRRLDYTQHMHRGNYTNNFEYPALKQDNVEVDSLTGHRAAIGGGSFYPDIDGVKVYFDDGWALVRCSNTGPNVTTRFEALTEDRLESIKNEFLDIIEKCKEELS